MSGMHLSKEFFELLKAIGESKSKQEEDRIIQREIATLKKKMDGSSSKGGLGGKLPTIGHGGGGGGGGSGSHNALNQNRKKAKEFLVRLLYVEMLGHDGSFGYIKAVELAASSSIIHKRTGYLLCSCCLAPEHEFRFMLVNQMQRDLASSSILEICSSLIAVTNLITSDMVPAMASHVEKLMNHGSEIVRKKAVIAYHRMYQLDEHTVDRKDLIDVLRKVLCDRDPSVMGSSLNVIESLATVDPAPFKDLVASLISILKQVIEHRLPSDFEYHRVPAPWIQMKIVRILAVVGKNDANASNGMYEILGECMRKADVGINAGYAVIYECVRTITSIYPNPTLLDAAADAISRFITSQSQNLKYFGVTGLAAIVESHPQYATAHQMSVIECLEDRDETLQRRTLDLLYKMTNPVNVQFITEKLLGFLRNTTDEFLKEDLTNKVCTLAERYAPNNLWYVETITDLFEMSGDFVQQEVAQNLMTLIAEGSGDDEEDENGEEADIILRQHAVTIYANLLEKQIAKLPRLLLETMAWVLGEYAYLSEEFTLEEILNKLCDLVKVGKQLAPSTRKIIVSAIMKLVAQAGQCPPQAAKVIDDFSKAKDVDLQQRCLEFQNLITTAPHMLGEILPVDASCEDVQVDPNLNFLDLYVRQAAANGAKEYNKPDDDDDDDEDYYNNYNSSKKKPSAFKMTPYEKPTKPGTFSSASMGGMGSGSKNTFGTGGGGGMSGVTPPPGAYGGNSSTQSSTSSNRPGEPQLNIRNVANVWGKGGLNNSGVSSSNTPAAPAPAAPSAPTSSAWSNSYTASSAVSSMQSSSSAPPSEPVKSEEQIRKERMAAALFGGGAPSTPSRVARRSVPRATPSRQTTVAAPSSQAPVAVAPVPPPVPAPAPPPAPEIDLLDFMSDPTPTSTTIASGVDMLSPTPLGESEPTPAPPPAPVVDEDPFAASGLLDGLSDAPLNSLISETKFQHNGQTLSPLQITTPQFGEKWGSTPFSSPLSATASKCQTIQSFMEICRSIGAYNIETITATNEGICGGMLGGGTHIILIHGKVSNGGRVDVTIKSTDQTISGCLAMYMQNLLR